MPIGYEVFTGNRTGLGDEPRRILDELSEINIVDVILPTRKGIEIRKRRITQPNEHQAILLQRPAFSLMAGPSVFKSTIKIKAPHKNLYRI